MARARLPGMNWKHRRRADWWGGDSEDRLQAPEVRTEREAGETPGFNLPPTLQTPPNALHPLTPPGKELVRKSERESVQG